MSRVLGGLLLLVIALLATVAPFIAPYAAETQFHDLLNAPPTGIQLRDAEGRWHSPFFHPRVRVNQLEQRYAASAAIVPLIWFDDGHLFQSSAGLQAPVLLLGADSTGRDVFSRLLFGARISLVLSTVAALLSIAVGTLVGAMAGYRGGFADDSLMRGSDILLVLPGMYVALLVRALLPPVLPVAQVFLLLVVIFALIGFPIVARGVRGIVRSESQREYAVAARAAGASPMRVLRRHLIPATTPFLAVQVTVLVPAFVVAEATFSYVGLGFPDSASTWGTMLQEASNASTLIDFPWLLSPVVAMFLVVMALHLVGPDETTSPEPSMPL